MTIDKEKLAELAKDCHDKQTIQEDLHKQYQKEKTAELSAQLAIASVEYRRAKKMLDNEMAEQSMIIINTN
jgi:hypothetical protein